MKSKLTDIKKEFIKKSQELRVSVEQSFELWELVESTISQTKQELIEEIKNVIEKKKEGLVIEERFCSNCIKERDEEDDELTGEIEPCQTHLISWFNIQTLEELLEKLSNK